MMVSASGVYITMLTGRRDNPDRCIVARDEYTARAQVIVCTSSIPVSRTKRHRRPEPIFEGGCGPLLPMALPMAFEGAWVLTGAGSSCGC
jgi:hypothetical protein